MVHPYQGEGVEEEVHPYQGGVEVVEVHPFLAGAVVAVVEAHLPFQEVGEAVVEVAAHPHQVMVGEEVVVGPVALQVFQAQLESANTNMIVSTNRIGKVHRNGSQSVKSALVRTWVNGLYRQVQM